MNSLMFELVLEKAEEPEIKMPTSAGSSKKRVPEKHLFLLSLPKPLTVWITINWKILKEMGIPDLQMAWYQMTIVLQLQLQHQSFQ